MKLTHSTTYRADACDLWGAFSHSLDPKRSVLNDCYRGEPCAYICLNRERYALLRSRKVIVNGNGFRRTRRMSGANSTP